MNLKRLKIEIEGPSEDVKRMRANMLPILGQRFYVLAQSHFIYKRFIDEIRCSPMVARYVSSSDFFRGLDNVTIVRLEGYQLHPEYVEIMTVLAHRRNITIIDIAGW